MNISDSIASITASAATTVGITAITIQTSHSAADPIMAAGLTAVAALTIAAEHMGRAAHRQMDDPDDHTDSSSADKPSVPALSHRGEGR